MKRVLFAAVNMNIGGVEKSLLSLLQTLDPSEYQVDLLLLEQTGGFLSDIPDWVNVLVLEEYATIKRDVNDPPISRIKARFASGQWYSALGMSAAYGMTKLTQDYSWYYRYVFSTIPKLPKKYDIAVSFSSIINYLSWYVIHHVNAEQKVGWIHFDVAKYGHCDKAGHRLHQQMDKIYVVSQESLEHFTAAFPDLADRCALRYNVVDSELIHSQADEPVESIRTPGEITIVTLGRLSPEKGQDIVPSVAKALLARGIHFRWYLIGDGILRPAILEKCRQLGVSDCVILLGTKKNPYPYLKQADIYVQTSIHEGYCITLAEARALNLPIVSTDFSGAREQLRGRADNIIVSRTTEAIYCGIITFVS